MTDVLKWIQWILLTTIVIVPFFLAFNVSLKESAIMDELAHIPAGYGYVEYLDFRLNPEHPPMVKALAAFPLLFLDVNFPTESSAWKNDVNGQWTMGAQFLYESGNDADEIIKLSRIGPMIFMALLVVFIYFWSKELIGRWWAFLPAFLFAFSPNVLAHGHYVTTDVGAALGIFIAVYCLVKFLLEPSRRNLLFAGLAFGFAQLLKFSAFLLIPFFLFLIFVFYFWKMEIDWEETPSFTRLKRFSIRLFRYIRSIATIFVIGYLLVFLVYALFSVNYPAEKQKRDTEIILTSFADGPDPEWKTCRLNSGAELSRRPRCLAEINIWMSGNKILRPFAQYLLGVLMVMQRSSGGNTAYFLGEVSASGWRHYFPTVFILKEPLPSLILIGLALILSMWNIAKKIRSGGSRFKIFLDYLGTHFAEFSMISFVIFYWLYSINSPLNIGVRHILPTIPFMYILTAGALRKWLNNKITISKNFLKTIIKLTAKFIKLSFKSVLLSFLIIWYLLETISAYPYYLSYFNQFAGGTENGYRYVTDSNYDWGQDLKRLKDWADKNLPAGKRIGVDYFGGGSPGYYLGEKAVYWQSAKGNPALQKIEWLAVSINTLQSAFGRLQPGQQRNPEDEYRWLKEIKDPYNPDAKAGTSIFIYKLF